MADSHPQNGTPPPPSGRVADPVPSDARTLRVDTGARAPVDPSQPTLALPEASSAGERQHDSQDFQGEPFGRYRLLLELGRGGMGVVHKAWDTQLRRPVALKQVLAEGGLTRAQTARFLREARLAARLRHPHIVGVLDVAEHQGRPYLTTEFLEARSLEAVLKRPVEPSQALRWVKAIAEALQYAHDAGVVHRDVKPSNILIDTGGRPFLTDFGLAKEVEAPVLGGTTLTLSGTLVGTPQYMSPEQASGRLERIGPAADQFSLGVVLYELLTGRVPFTGNGLRELLNAISETDPVPPRKLKAAIDRDAETICLKAIEKDPARRYARIGDLAADLGRLLAGDPILARPRSLPEKFTRLLSRHRRVVLAVAATAALVLVAGVPFLRDRARRTEEARGERDVLDRQRAEAERARREAEAVLEKAVRAQAVFGRWVSLATSVHALEAAFYDGRLPDDELRRRAEEPWNRVQRFVDETPPDSASQCVARALAGRARRLAGYSEEGLAWMREAQRLDPDLPHGVLMEALACFSECVVHQPLPSFTVGADRISFGPPRPETPEMAQARARMERLMGEAARARVWGEGTDRDFRAVLEAMRAMQEGRLVDAEAGFTSVIGSPAMLGGEGDILLARAKVRYMLGEFREGIEDAERLLEARPEDGVAWRYYGNLLTGLALSEEAAGKDPLPLLARAIERYGGALERSASDVAVLTDRGIALSRMGEAMKDRGLDGREALDAAIRDFTELIKAQGLEDNPHVNRGGVLLSRANAEESLGGDPIPHLDAAIQDLDEAIRLGDESPYERIVRAQILQRRAVAGRARGEDSRPLLRKALEDLDRNLALAPGDADALASRGNVYREIAAELSTRGEDGSESCRFALRDLDESLRIVPNSVLALVARAKTHRVIGDLAREARGDTDPHYERALADLGRVIALRPSDTDGWNERGLTRTAVGQARHLQGDDARDILQGAIDDFGEVLARNPASLDAMSNRGVAWTRFAEAQGKRHIDPRPSFRRAVADYDEIIRRAPSHAKAWLYRALARIVIGDANKVVGEDPGPPWEEALGDLAHVEELEPANWRARATRGLLLQKQGKTEEAIRAYEEALEICPGQPTVKTQLDALRKK